jgi:DNA-binding NarL/FixJ family response regulator
VQEQRVRTVIVDDDGDALFLLRHRLERSGVFEVVGEARDGAEAVRVAADLRPALVLMDLNMPKVDGLTALPLVRAVLDEDAAVVVMSARPSDAALQAVAEGRARAFLEKATGYDGLVRDLTELLDDRAGSQEAVGWHYAADASICSLARRQLTEVLRVWGFDHVLDEAQLLMTELVTNAILHASSAVDVELKRRAGGIRVEVTDTGAGALERVDAELDDTHGRGLMLVEVMASDWGTASNGTTKTVWFELREAQPVS